jgi:hypothetical protein
MGTSRSPDAACEALLATTPDGDDAAVVVARRSG